MRQQADYLRESIERINRVDPQPGEMDELRARRDRIENAAEIAEGVTRALGALDASQVADDVESASAADLIDRASQALACHSRGRRVLRTRRPARLHQHRFVRRGVQPVRRSGQ